MQLFAILPLLFVYRIAVFSLFLTNLCYNIINMSRRNRKRFSTELVIPDSPIHIDRLATTGQGIGTGNDGVKIFFWNALPGENVKSYRIIKKRAHLLEAIAEEIENKNENRAEPKDEQFLSTSPWQIMTNEFEIKSKTEILKELYRNLLKNTDKDNKIIFNTDGNSYFYRNKMEYSLYFDFTDEKIKLSIHRRGSHQKLPIKTSSLERPEIFEKAIEIVEKLNAKHDEARKYQSLLLRSNQNGEVSGGLFEKGKPHPKFNNLEDKILGKTYSYSPNGFFQINLPVYEMALKRIKELASNSEKILDLYSGVGTIGLSILDDKNSTPTKYQSLTLVEVDKSAYRELVENCKTAEKNLNALVRPILSKSEEALNYIEPDSVVILDPPRAGCDKKLIEKLVEIKPKKIIYLSCNPITQARDVELLVLAGAKLNSLEGFNFFPKTPHIESLVSLEF